MVLNTLIKYYDQFPHVKEKQDSDQFLQALHNYYVTNLKYEKIKSWFNQ